MNAATKEQRGTTFQHYGIVRSARRSPEIDSKLYLVMHAAPQHTPRVRPSATLLSASSLALTLAKYPLGPITGY